MIRSLGESLLVDISAVDDRARTLRGDQSCAVTCRCRQATAVTTTGAARQCDRVVSAFDRALSAIERLIDRSRDQSPIAADADCRHA